MAPSQISIEVDAPHSRIPALRADYSRSNQMDNFSRDADRSSSETIQGMNARHLQVLFVHIPVLTLFFEDPVLQIDVSSGVSV